MFYKVAFVNLLYLPLLCEKNRANEKYVRLYAVDLLLINRFMNFWLQNYVDFSCGGDGTGQNTQFCMQKELNAKIHAGEFLKSTSTHIPNRPDQFRGPAHV